MKNSKSLDTTFKAIRELPLEISLAQVRLWVENAPPIPLEKTKRSILKLFPPFWNKN